MAQQWWGNTLTAASFHDQWLASGLASFSASVFDAEVNNGDYKERWNRAHEDLLSKNRFGVRPNDAGPVWMGLLNDAPKTPAASGLLNAQKGAFVIQMLRSLMWDPHSGDSDFQAMMQDFVATFTNSRVSTEDFKKVVEKHMKPPMNIDGNRQMDWFFDEWIYGTEIPSYRLEYSLKPGESGSSVMDAKLTQSGVSPSFRMLVPIFGEFVGRKDRLGVVAIRGNSTLEFKATSAQRPKQVLLNINHDILSDKDEVVIAKR
jgi:aminopeptidase N